MTKINKVGYLHIALFSWKSFFSKKISSHHEDDHDDYDHLHHHAPHAHHDHHHAHHDHHPDLSLLFFCPAGVTLHARSPYACSE